MLSSSYRRLCIIALFCSVLLGCAANEEATILESLERARIALKAKRYHDVLRLLNEVDYAVGQRPPKEYHLILSLASFKLGDYRRAVNALEQIELHSLQLHIYMTYLHLLLGDAQRSRSIAAALELHHGQQAEISILQGNISLKEHAYQEAEQHFRSAILLDESSVKAYIGLGNTFLLQRYFVKAEENYIKAVVLSKSDADPYIALLNYYIATGRYDDAEYTATIATSRYPDNINLLMVKSNLFMNIGKISEGFHLLEKALEIFPHSIDLKTRLIRNYFNLARLDEAHRLIQRILTDDNDNYHGLILLGEYYLRRNDIEIASFHFNKAQLINNNSYIINYYLGLIGLLKNKTRLAVQFLQKSIQNFPGFIKSHLLLSIVYIYQQKYDLASEHAKLILQLDPRNTEAHLINSVSLYLQDYLNEAKYELDVIDIFDSKNQIIRILQILIDLEMKNFPQLNAIHSNTENDNVEKLFLLIEFTRMRAVNVNEAQKILDAYVNHNHNYFIYILLANFYKESHDLDKAKDYFLKANVANDDVVIPYYGLAELEAMQGNRTLAIGYLRQAIERKPYFVKSYKALGSLYEQIKDYQNAKTIYEQGLHYAPEDSVLLNNLAWVNLVHFGDKSAAYIGIKRALSLAPEDPDIQDTLGWWYYLNGDYQHALVLLKRIVEANPANPLYRYHLGMVFFGIGEEQVARVHLQRAAESGINDEYKAAIMEIIK
jgi:tetratricopeptide (TPR) repeat protein